MTRLGVLVAAASVFWIMAMSDDVADAMNSESIRDASIVDRVPDDHPIGIGATVTPVSVERAKNLNDATLSTFLVDFPPGASAVLHRMPSSGYVLVHVLSGTVSASAWHAGVDIYRTGETWVEPAFASSIVAANSNSEQPARALVILVTQDAGLQAGRPTWSNEKPMRQLVKSPNGRATEASTPYESGVEAGSPRLRVIFVPDLADDVLRRSGIKRGMRVLDLECAAGDASLDREIDWSFRPGVQSGIRRFHHFIAIDVDGI